VKKIDLKQAADFLATYSPKESDEPIVLMNGKKPIAVLVPTGDADLETISLCYSPAFHAILERSQRSAETGRSYTSEEIRQEFNLPPFDPERARANGKRAKPKAAKSAAVRKSKVKR
jgi:hypothetical protein